jgi:hypothetical protein
VRDSGGAPGARPSPEELRRAVEGAISVAGALRRLGLPVTTALRRRFAVWIAEDGAATDHFLGQGHRRGRRASNARAPEEILVRHDRPRRTSSYRLRRALRTVGVPERCAECGQGPEWLGRPLTLEVDHLDGDWRNDRRENLRLLCPNCHATTRTWCRGGSRTHSPVQ